MDIGNELEINIAIIGFTSVGKSTFVNALCKKQCSETGIQPTTTVSHIYVYSPKNDSDKYYQLTELISNKNIKIKLYDLPGIDDLKTYEWVKNNINMFNIIIFMTDINKALHNNDEVEIFENIVKLIAGTNIKMICLINKCDDIFYDAELHDLIIEEKEIEDIYVNSNLVLDKIIKKYNTNNIYPFIPICAENSFIYSVLYDGNISELNPIYLTRLCKNEFGKTKWNMTSQEEKLYIYQHIMEYIGLDSIDNTEFNHVKQIIKSIIDEHIKTFVMDNILLKQSILKSCDLDNPITFIELIKEINNLYQDYTTLFGYESDLLCDDIKISITNYVTKIIQLDYRLIRSGYLIRYDQFKNIKDVLQSQYINFITITDYISTLFVLDDFLISNKKLLLDKIIYLYDQIASLGNNKKYIYSISLYNCVNNLNQYILPSNLIKYLQFINIHLHEKFDLYAYNFLNFICKNPNYIYIDPVKQDIINLITYVIDNVANKKNIVHQIYKILINIQYQISTEFTETNFYYFLTLKHSITMLILTGKLSNTDMVLKLLMEVIDKNISIYISVDGFKSVYKQDVDYRKVHLLLDNMSQGETLIDIDFENDLLELIY